MLKAAAFLPPHEQPGEDFRYVLITGRTLYHFHTRTKTARAPPNCRLPPRRCGWKSQPATRARKD